MQMRSSADKLWVIFLLEGGEGEVQPCNFIPVSSENQQAIWGQCACTTLHLIFTTGIITIL